MASAAWLPPGLNLFIATAASIRAYGRSTSRTLFECVTDGIVNARAARDNSSLIAVADNHVVLLHDAARGTDRNYWLKNGEVSPNSPAFAVQTGRA